MVLLNCVGIITRSFWMNFGNEIIKWYQQNKRDLPWRNTRDPYLIWLSEIILQQTRIDQGLSYYHRFAEKYPDVKLLAAAKEDDVLKLWQGLGYYTRARNLHKAAKQITTAFSGKFPSEHNSIKSLKGVGDYTAAAIASFAFDLKYPVVDGNVFRLLSRFYGIETPIDTSAGKKEFTEIAGTLMRNHSPAVFNQAIMEFGSRVCKPANPECEMCPLNISCYAFKNNCYSSFPVKKNKTKTSNRYFNYLVIQDKNSFFIRKRNAKDIWQGLHDFPMIETKSSMKQIDFLKSDDWKNTFKGHKVKLTKVSPEFKHVLSHQLIYATFYEISADINLFNETENQWKKVNAKSVKKYAVPKLIERYIEMLVDSR